MGVAERREREREALRMRIVEAARDIISEEGLNALSMRAIAERIEYSPGTIYLYFADKDALLREVVEQGFYRLGEYMREELVAAGGEVGPADQYRALGRGYARFAMDNTAYFRVMFELPGVAQIECDEAEAAETVAMTDEHSWSFVAAVMRRAVDEGEFVMPDADRGAVIGWGMIHGLTALFLSGHLRDEVASREEFLRLVEEAMDTMATGWLPRR